MPADPMLVRVAPEIVEMLERGDVSPVIILGAQLLDDGTHELYLREPDVEAPALKALVALLADGSVRAAATPEHLELARAAGWEATRAY